MNINHIARIINNREFSDDIKKQLIINELASDKDVIPTILSILSVEREVQKELLLDTNAELSRAFIVLKDKNLETKKKKIVDPKWVVGEIMKHYLKWAEYIRCCFKVEGLP